MTDWRQDGEDWTRDSVAGPVRIRPVGDLFRVAAAIPPLAIRDCYESASLDECKAFGDSVVSHAESVTAWTARGIRETRPGPLPGSKVRVSKDEDDPMAHIRIDMPGEEGVAKLSFAHSRQACCFVVGRNVIDGSPRVDEAYRRKGLSNWMHDLAEEVAGLPFVPHGRNLCVGFLTPGGEAFWDRRSETRNVPGHADPAAAERTALFEAATRFIHLEQRMMPTLQAGMQFAVLAALATGGEIEGVTGIVDEGLHESFARCWCVLPDGRALSSRGILSEAEVAALRALPLPSSAEPGRTGRFSVDEAVRMQVAFRSLPESVDIWAEHARGGYTRNWADAATLLRRHLGTNVARNMPPSLEIRLDGMFEAACAAVKQRTDLPVP